MDFILSKVGQQAMSFAIRSGLTITTGFAFQQYSRLVKTTSGAERRELAKLQRRLDAKIRIISPAIDMIELIAARGNTSLESAVSLTKGLRCDIQDLGQRLARAAADAEMLSAIPKSPSTSKDQHEKELQGIIDDVKALLDRIEDAVPLVNLAITTSGVNLSSSMPSSVSPSRLLQASTFLTAGDVRYGASDLQAVQIGPTFVVSMYMLFLGHAKLSQQEEDTRVTTWKEVMHKAEVKILRVPLERVSVSPFEDQSTGPENSTRRDTEDGIEFSFVRGKVRNDEFAYQLSIIEDLQDDRVHTFEEGEEQPESVGGVELAGIRQVVPVHEVSKVFYADTGKILNIGSEGESHSPILLLKRDVNATPPRRMVERDDLEEMYNLDEHDDTTLKNGAGHDAADELRNTTQQKSWRLPTGLDPEWIALEVYNEESDSESEVDDEPATSRPGTRQGSLEPNLLSALAQLHIGGSSPLSSSRRESSNNPKLFQKQQRDQSLGLSTFGPVKTSLSLLEMLMRLASLQQFQQCSHLSITDELLNVFLEESSTTGASSPEARRRVRMEARDRVGFDPYNESPIKRRGEACLHQRTTSTEVLEPYAPEPWYEPTRRVESPYLLRSREHSSAPSSPRNSGADDSTPPLPGRWRTGSAAPATPPSTTKSREVFLKEEAASGRGIARGKGSPLAQAYRSPDT